MYSSFIFITASKLSPLCAIFFITDDESFNDFIDKCWSSFSNRLCFLRLPSDIYKYGFSSSTSILFLNWHHKNKMIVHKRRMCDCQWLRRRKMKIVKVRSLLAMKKKDDDKICPLDFHSSLLISNHNKRLKISCLK